MFFGRRFRGPVSMKVRYRTMRPRDVRTCVDHLAAHPVLGPRYGSEIKHFPSALFAVLGYDSAFARVFEEVQGSTTRFLGVGLAVFVSYDFLRQIKTAPPCWAGPELVKRIASGKSPIVSDTEVRRANATVGLNLYVWHCTFHPEDIKRAELITALMTAFQEGYRGFQLRELLQQADCLEHLYGMCNAGGLYFDRRHRSYGNFPEIHAHNFLDEPRNVGMTRDLAMTRLGSWVGTLFLYTPPRLGLSASEQRLLYSAFSGGTDEELSDMLGISLFAVKKSWRAIYERVAECLPELVPDRSEINWADGKPRQAEEAAAACLPARASRGAAPRVAKTATAKRETAQRDLNDVPVWQNLAELVSAPIPPRDSHGVVALGTTRPRYWSGSAAWTAARRLPLPFLPCPEITGGGAKLEAVVNWFDDLRQKAALVGPDEIHPSAAPNRRVWIIRPCGSLFRGRFCSRQRRHHLHLRCTRMLRKEPSPKASTIARRKISCLDI